jgi:hypothetical protein
LAGPLDLLFLSAEDWPIHTARDEKVCPKGVKTNTHKRAAARRPLFERGK